MPRQSPWYGDLGLDDRRTGGDGTGTPAAVPGATTARRGTVLLSGPSGIADGDNASVPTAARVKAFVDAAIAAIPSAAQRSFAAIATGLNALAAGSRLSYNSLDDLPEAVKPDWDAAEGTAAEILNKPTIPAVRGNGNYLINVLAGNTNPATGADTVLTIEQWRASSIITFAGVQISGLSEWVLTLPIDDGQSGRQDDEIAGQSVLIRSVHADITLYVMTAQRMRQRGRGFRNPVQVVTVPPGRAVELIVVNSRVLVGDVTRYLTATDTVLGLVEEATIAELRSGTADKWPDAATIKAYIDERLAAQG